MGLAFAICGALLLNSSNILVSAPSPRNLNVLFTFMEHALTRLGYKKNRDFNVKSDTDGNKIQLEFFVFSGDKEGGKRKNSTEILIFFNESNFFKNHENRCINRNKSIIHLNIIK